MSSSEPRIVFHKGVYKKAATLSEAVFLITGVTIGAGILGLPYAIAQVGLGIGLIYIVALGVVMLLLNLMIGEVVAETKKPLQIAGLAEVYIGRWAGYLLVITTIIGSYGALVAYVVGEGETFLLQFCERVHILVRRVTWYFRCLTFCTLRHYKYH
jgi:amino acid permease